MVFYYLSSSEIWTGKVGRTLLEGDFLKHIVSTVKIFKTWM